MHSIRAVLRAASAVALVLAAACADSTSTGVQPVPIGPDAPSTVRLACVASVATRTVQCDAPGAAGLRADRILGSGTGIKLTSSNIAIVADSFMFDMTVTNQFEHPVGTTDGVNPDPNGIRVFFVDGIQTTSGTGTVTVANADGVDAFTAAGQAFFAYHGVLQPGATTAPKRWKLHFDPGVATFSFGLYISTPVPPGGGSVWFTVSSPTQNSVWADTVPLFAHIDSASASTQSVTAYVADRSVALSPSGDGPGFLQGTLSLAGLPFGTYQLRVHAVTVRADTANVYRTIQKDAPPTLTVAQPTANFVARPNLRIDADCVDDDPAGCSSITARAGAVVLASGTTGIHADVSLSAMNETQQTITIEALDSGGHKRTYTASVYVQSGSLVFVDSAGSKAVDVDPSRLLFADVANGVWIRERPGGTRTPLQASPYGNVYGFLYPAGAVFGREANGRLYDWRAGTIVDVSTAASQLVVKGTWAGWASGTSLVGRRDLVASATEFVGGSAHPDVGPNGDLVYDDGTGKVYRQRTTFETRVVVDSAGSNSPITDGNLVVYQKGFLMSWNGTTSTVLTTTPGGSTPHTHYEINAGWIAYTVVDGGGASQVRVRAPGGTDTQVTSSASSSVIRALSSEGTLVFARGGAVYVLRAPYTATPTRLGKDWFTVRFRGTDLYLLLGNTALSASY